MRLYRCSDCKCGFAILAGQKNKGAKAVTCPQCALSEHVDEVDPAEAIGGRLVREALKIWKRLPSGD